LVVPVDGHSFFELVTLRVAHQTLALVDLGFLTGVVVVGAFDILALFASEVDGLQFREHSGSLGDDSSNLDESVEMHLTKVSKLVLNRELFDAHKNLIVNFAVVRINLFNETHRHFIHSWQHQGGLFS
jgi:hypothetical protein